jgi:hypothetical protein
VRKRFFGGFAWIAVVSAAFLAGCLETEAVLGPVEQASVDARLIGDFKTGDDGGTDITVRNFNGREYYVEQRAAGEETVRYGGHITVVKGASFLHLRQLSDDGTSSKSHVILRVDRVDDAKVNLRQLNAEFFAEKPHDTTATLRAIVETNVENPAMYEPDGVSMLTRKRAE